MSFLRYLIIGALAVGVATTSASAQSDYTVRAGSRDIAPSGTYRLGFDKMKEVFNTHDMVAVCYTIGDIPNALLLRVSQSFYALNGNARSTLVGSTIRFGNKDYKISDSRSEDAVDRNSTPLIQMARSACPN